jgi:hypothetical protein
VNGTRIALATLAAASLLTAACARRNAAGRTIGTTTMSVELYVGTHHPPPGTTAPNPSCAH